MRKFLMAPVMVLSGCAVLHHAQVGDIDCDARYNLRPITLMVSEMGLNLDEAKSVAQSFTHDAQSQKAMQDVKNAIAMFQQGPRTGNPVFNDKYAENMIHDIYKECPSGRITGITSIRETRKYPVISGEIVKIKAFCMEKRT
ncbi:MAG: hypothetical protein HYR96_15295 [Deltaproteobacteria bacterium]|nr:hypothetical protein [Deltaproteobacteria bacterium]MBI3296241.1 hypothetical protein [Deltaproteobacteria bacterium]